MDRIPICLFAALRHKGRVALSKSVTLALLSVLTGACASKPPPDYAPDPGLVARIVELRMHVGAGRACPGNVISASYDAVLDDGSTVPFSTRYDDEHPPPLHVLFLNRSSAEARPRNDGGWDTNADPLVSAVTGFRLSAFLRAKPSVAVEQVVEPEYSCLRHAFSFSGARGGRGQVGHPGPDITVRVNILSSPFYERLLVAGVEVGRAPPFYVLADADYVPPADWIIVESRGGPGGRGIDGSDGAEGTKGADGCPAGTGGAGGAGGNGGPGGPGGPGGRTTVMVPDDLPLLAGMVEAHSSGGPGGSGGRAGKGGAGGEGGRGIAGTRRCASGAAGPAGADGNPGVDGPEGTSGPRASVLTVPASQVFVDPRLQDILDHQFSGGS